jgi:mRNA interferase RelE/StbE
MAYRIEFSSRARKALAGLPRRDLARILVAIQALGAEPRPAGCKPVRTAPKGTYRIRIGDYRAIYTVLDDEQVIVVARVTRRDESTYESLG